MRTARIFVLISLSFCFAACRHRSRVEVWLIPEGYVGWLRLDYSVQGSPPLPTENGNYVVRISRSGRLQTSSDNNPSIDDNLNFIDKPQGRQAVAFARQSVSYAVQNAYSVAWSRSPHDNLECVFIGTNADLKSDGRNCAAWAWGEPRPPMYRHLRRAPEPAK